MEWKAEYATGIHNIDDQHRIVVEFVTEFERAAQAQPGADELHRLLARTDAFLQFHFHVEESLMQLLPYPHAAAHRLEHQAILRQIAAVESRLLRARRPDNLALLMRDYLFEHIVVGDKWLAQYALELYSWRPARSAPLLRARDGAARSIRW